MTQDKLDNLILKLIRNDAHSAYPGNKVYEIRDQVVPQEHITHHEYQRHCQLDLQLVEPRKRPRGQVLRLERQQDEEHNDAIQVLQGRPKEDRVKVRVVQLVDQDQLVKEDRKHQIELDRKLVLVLVFVRLAEYVTNDHDLVQQDQKRKIRGRLLGLAFGYKEEKLALIILQLKLKQVPRPFHKIVKLILRCRLNDDTVIEVIQVVIEPEHIHCAWVKLVRLVALIFQMPLLNICVVLTPIYQDTVGVAVKDLIIIRAIIEEVV